MFRRWPKPVGRTGTCLGQRSKWRLQYCRPRRPATTGHVPAHEFIEVSSRHSGLSPLSRTSYDRLESPRASAVASRQIQSSVNIPLLMWLMQNRESAAGRKTGICRNAEGRRKLEVASSSSGAAGCAGCRGGLRWGSELYCMYGGLKEWTLEVDMEILGRMYRQIHSVQWSCSWRCTRSTCTVSVSFSVRSGP